MIRVCQEQQSSVFPPAFGLYLDDELPVLCADNEHCGKCIEDDNQYIKWHCPELPAFLQSPPWYMTPYILNEKSLLNSGCECV